MTSVRRECIGVPIIGQCSVTSGRATGQNAQGHESERAKGVAGDCTTFEEGMRHRRTPCAYAHLRSSALYTRLLVRRERERAKGGQRVLRVCRSCKCLARASDHARRLALMRAKSKMPMHAPLPVAVHVHERTSA